MSPKRNQADEGGRKPEDPGSNGMPTATLADRLA